MPAVFGPSGWIVPPTSGGGIPLPPSKPKIFGKLNEKKKIYTLPHKQGIIRFTNLLTGIAKKPVLTTVSYDLDITKTKKMRVLGEVTNFKNGRADELSFDEQWNLIFRVNSSPEKRWGFNFDVDGYFSLFVDENWAD